MRQWFLNFILLVFSWGMCGCEQEEYFGKKDTAEGRDIHFSIGFAPMTRVNTDLAFDCSWEKGDEIGIFAVKAGEPLKKLGNYIHNARLFYDGEQWNYAQEKFLMWPEDVNELTFYAYYPYDDNSGYPELVNPTRIVKQVSMVQNDKSGERLEYNVSDCLTAQASAETGSKVELNFSHLLSLIQLTVLPGNNTAEKTEGLEVMLEDVKTKYSLNLDGADGPETKLAKANNDAVRLELCCAGKNENGHWVYRGLVPPQTLETGYLLVVAEGQVVTETAPFKSLLLEAGKGVAFQFRLPDMK